MTSARQNLGKWGENLAAGFLARQGYIIIERNARTPYGELDLVARQACAEAGADQPGEVIVFVEVKTRTSTAFGAPEAAVNPRKQAHLLAAAQAYLQNHPELGGDWRVDVIAIERPGAGQSPTITHFEDALR